MAILPGFLRTKKYRRLGNDYKLQSEWTSSTTVEMGDGNTAETNLGAIEGITSSLATENNNYALSASAGKSLQDQVTQLNTDLSSLIIRSVIINGTGNYGYIKDCVGSVCYKNKTAFFHIEGEISGTVDLFFTDFGLPPNLKTPISIYGDVSSGQYKLLAKTEDEAKNTLRIKAFSNSTSVQLSATATGYYGATFAVAFA